MYWKQSSIARLLRVNPSTIRSYRARGKMPEPDAFVLGNPRWTEPTLKKWHPELDQHDSVFGDVLSRRFVEDVEV